MAKVNRELKKGGWKKEDLIIDGQLNRIISRLRYDDRDALVAIADGEL